ncbi:PAS domain S-box protein [Methylosinus sp. Sm6]|uniref:PAS domain S-box protein n=1 Tax=Methylosinus sp. Sm6 TaxID=2866948 RepID=UPI001C99DA6F|nr:PAS domain S-box protein [Methylosinus sp. Sm6]MBY6243894.1 PAS domain S-box protein [Methylosinus sp. Sm6]
MLALETDTLWVVNWSVDPNGCCHRIEPDWRRATGRSPDSALGGGWREAIHPNDRPRVAAELDLAARSARPFQIVFRLERADGGFRRAMALGSPQRDARGAFVGYDGSIIDAPDRETAEPESVCEQRFRSLFETSCDGIVTVDMSGHILEANPAYQKMLGYTLEELRRLTYHDLTPKIWRDMEERIVQEQILARGESAEYEKEYIRKDGGVFPIGLRAWLVADENGRAIGMRAFVRDITERKRAEAALRASERRFRAIFDQQFQYSVLLSPDGRVVELNDAVVRGTGVTQEEMVGKPLVDGPWWSDLPDMRATWRRHFEEARARPGPSRGEGVYRGRDGALRHALNTVTALRDEHGVIESLLVEGIDITEAKSEAERAEASLRDSEERFRMCFANASIGFAMHAPDYRFLEANPAFCAITGYSCEELLGRKGSDLVHPDDWPASEASTRKMLAGETPGFVIENRYVRKTGDSIWVRKSLSLIRRADGAPRWIITLVEDVTERRQAEEALRRSRNDLDRAQEVGKIGWWRLDVRENVLTWSDENHRIFGVPKGAPMSYESFLDIVHPDDRAYVDMQWQASLHGAPYDIEHRIVVAGRTNWVREKAYLEFDEAGALLGGFGVTQDITERKAAEHALLWHMRRNELLSEAAALLLESTDPRRLAEDICNKVMAFLDCDVFFNYLVNEETGRLRLNACAGAPAEWVDALASPEPGAAVCGCGAREGRRILAEDIQRRDDLRAELVRSFGIQAYCCHPLLHQDRVIGTLSFGTRSRIRFSDDEIAVMKAVADLVAIAMRRVQTEQALRDADRRKDEFIATLAHELRNPLAPIGNAAHILTRKYGADFPDAPLIAMVQRQVDHLVRLVDDLLEISRISRGKIELRKESVAVSDFLRHALDASRPLIDKKGHRLDVKLAAEPLRAFGDPVRLAQIAANIINNAAKYTPPGGRIDIETAREGKEAVLRVRDNGVGIAPEMMPRVFDLFAQTQDQMRLSEGGLGIGLALVRKLVEMHGGRVEAQSAGSGRGSQFAVFLPLAEEPAAATAPVERTSAGEGGGARALVVDDDHDVADSFALLLESLGATVRKAYDGPAGVAALEAFEPHIAFVDLGMPGVDGYETARRMRASGGRRRFLLVALTGWGQENDRRRAQDAGFDLHLTKPASIDAVEELLRRVQPADGGDHMN